MSTRGNEEHTFKSAGCAEVAKVVSEGPKVLQKLQGEQLLSVSRFGFRGNIQLSKSRKCAEINSLITRCPRYHGQKAYTRATKYQR